MKPMLCVVFGLLLVGCGEVTTTDLVGTYSNPDGAILVLKTDGTFSARTLPAQVFLGPDSIDGPITGSGRWRLEPHNLLWHGDSGHIHLDFDDMPGFPPRMEVQAIVSDRRTLYQWKGEEGGERYELKKQ